MPNQEQINFLAKAITDSYFQNQEECKMLSPIEYAKRYMVIFEIAQKEVVVQMNLTAKIEAQQEQIANIL